MSSEHRNRADIRLEKLAFREDFQKDIQDFRVNNKIPSTGFISIEDFNRWHKNKKLEIFYAFKLNDLSSLLQKYKLPITYARILESHILSNHKLNRNNYTYHSSCELASYANSASINKEWKKTGRKYSVIFIDQDATGAIEVKEFIDKNWLYIEKTIFSSGIKRTASKKIRPLSNIERDKLVLMYSKKSSEELDFNPKRDVYKEIAIARKLKEDHGIEIDSDYIKSLIFRRRKRS